MSTPPEGKNSVVKLALKRAELAELVLGDAALRAMPFIKALGGFTDAVLKQGTARRYPNLAVLFQQGDPGSSLYFVLKGEVRLSGRKGSESVELGTAVRGDVFGEAEILSGHTQRSGFAVAQGELDVAEFPRAALLQGPQLIPQLAAFLKPITAARQAALHEMTDFMNRW